MEKKLDKLTREIFSLPSFYLEELADYVQFLKQQAKKNTDTVYLSQDKLIKESIIQGMKTPLSKCEQTLKWD